MNSDYGQGRSRSPNRVDDWACLAFKQEAAAHNRPEELFEDKGAIVKISSHRNEERFGDKGAKVKDIQPL